VPYVRRRAKQRNSTSNGGRYPISIHTACFSFGRYADGKIQPFSVWEMCNMMLSPIVVINMQADNMSANVHHRSLQAPNCWRLSD
jgi:hypothetical protein